MPRQYQVRTGPLVNDAAPFSPEMVAGNAPPSPRLFVGPRLGLQIGQPTHVQAAFSVEMVAGQSPTSPRPTRGKTGFYTAPVETAPFAFEMLVSSLPDRARLVPQPHVGWATSQPTHVAAPFSHEMVVGNLPTRWRAPFVRQDGWRSPYIEVGVFAFEMLIGNLPPRARLFTKPRLGWQIAQPTHTAAPFTPDMIAGSAPPRARTPFRRHEGISSQPIDVTTFNPAWARFANQLVDIDANRS